MGGYVPSDFTLRNSLRFTQLMLDDPMNPPMFGNNILGDADDEPDRTSASRLPRDPPVTVLRRLTMAEAALIDDETGSSGDGSTIESLGSDIVRSHGSVHRSRVSRASSQRHNDPAAALRRRCEIMRLELEVKRDELALLRCNRDLDILERGEVDEEGEFERTQVRSMDQDQGGHVSRNPFPSQLQIQNQRVARWATSNFMATDRTPPRSNIHSNQRIVPVPAPRRGPITSTPNPVRSNNGNEPPPVLPPIPTNNVLPPANTEVRDNVQPTDQVRFIAPPSYSSADIGNIVQQILPLAQMLSQGNPNTNSTIQQQMLTRQSVNKDLPIYSGEIEDWPTFISQYRHSTEICGLSNTENMLRLQKCLRGKARELVVPILGLPENVEEVIQSLESTFGRSDLLIKNCIAKAKAVFIPKELKADSLLQFSNVVRNMVATFESLNCNNHTNNPQLLEELVIKLPMTLQMQWCQIVFQRGHNVNICDLSDWLKIIASTAALLPTSLPSNHLLDQKKPPEFKTGFKRGFYDHEKVYTADTKNPRLQMKCYCCDKSNHTTDRCTIFKGLKVDARWKMVSDNKLCFICLNRFHQTVNCPSRKACGVENCKSLHHPLLHRVPPTSTATNTAFTGHGFQSTIQTTNVHLRVIPVKLTGPAGVLNTYALLDDGSTVTLVASKIASQLGLQGPVEPLCFSWTNNTTQTDAESMRVQVGICGDSQGVKSYTLRNCRTVKDFDLPLQYLNMNELRKMWPYLRDVPFSSLKGAKPTILIGQDNSLLTLPRKLKTGFWHSPVASKSLLGWSVHGNSSVNLKKDSHFALTVCSHHENEDDILHQLVKRSFLTEDFGVKILHEIPRSIQDLRGFELLHSTTKRVGERWETGLLWANDEFTYPESFKEAYRRLLLIEKTMDSNADYARQYCDKIEDTITKGYAREVSSVDLAKKSPKARFLCHFSITNPNKPGKIRVVHDAKAKSKGVSFNDMLITGPDLLRPLPAVLWNFRKKKVAYIADVKEMFPQILIRDEDIVSQRFLWRGMNRDIAPKVYEMKSMIFGASCSPSSAIYVLNRNAEEFKDEFPKVFKATTKQMYMDDHLDSEDSEDEAITQIKDMIEVFRRGGFCLCNWMCTSKKVLKALPDELRAANFKDLNLEGDLPTERVLGMWWSSEKDEFTYRLNFHKVSAEVKDGLKIPTKRDVLKLVMSIYDPLGFLAFFVVRARILLQDIWSLGIDWDTEINNELFARWQAWLSDLQKITEIRIPRCYDVYFSKSSSIELHVFCDASKKAYASVAYFRITTDIGISLAIVSGKVRVASLKPMSIPRLELQAAVMASRLASTIRKEHDVKIKQTYFWSDSKTVISWIRSESRRFKTFVAHRICEIQDISNINDWRWIPTDLNVSDDATRDVGKCDLSSSSRWFQGPSFLLESEDKWPTENDQSLEIDNSEIKSEFVGIIHPHNLRPAPNINNFSSWIKLIRSTAWFLRSIKILFNKLRKIKEEFSSDISAVEFKEAELWWIRKCQEEFFSNEITLLQNSKLIPPQSKLFQLSPVLDVQGLLRVDGRINNSDVQEDVKSPYILDSKNRFIYLLIMHYHQKLGHQGQETILNDLRQKYWILSARCLIKKLCRFCLQCRKRKCEPRVPLMGQLPSFRVTRQVKVFNHVGIDFFGPLNVLSEGKRVKKYGVIFTCLTIRAIHLEIADNLTTDSTINAIRRFVSRRGLPITLISDNGTNFRKADRQLRISLKNFDQNQLQQGLSKDGINWMFNPPAAPHFGGAWERLIRSVKTALNAILKEKSTKFEILRTVFAEVEHIVNSRPLTCVSSNPADLKSICPNDFLIMNSNTVLSPGDFSKGLRFKDAWKTAQKLIDNFWQRWVKEFLPTLLQRTRWLQSTESLKIGNVVILVDPNSSRNFWPMGYISKIFPGKDGIVRVVDVTTNTGTYRRPLTRVCVLDLDKTIDEDE